MTLRGIDVSRWQGGIAWKTVAPQVDFALIKCGGGDDLSPYFDSMASANVIGARQAGIPFGLYWFYSGRSTVAEQARLIAQFHAGQPGNALPWAVDIEDVSRGADEILGGLKLAAEVERITGVSPLIYTGAWWWNPRWDLARRMGAPAVIPYGLWVAAYTDTPTIPHGWTDYTVWQHSDKGRIAGVTGFVDLDQARARFWEAAPREVSTPKYRITATALNLRAAPNAASDRLAEPPLPGGAIVDADPPVGGWHRVKLDNGKQSAGGVSFTPPIKYRVPDYGYISAGWTEPVIVPPPAATGKTRLGVNVITGSGDVARRALAAGCNALSIIDNFQLAADLANDTSITVMARRYTGNSLPPPDPDVLYEGASSPHVVYLGLNECDAVCYGSPGEIAARAAWDRDMWRRMKARGRKYAGGGFSVGTPDYTKPEICDAMREHYAPLYADGMAINYHLYSPWPTHAMDVWYELRWRFLFERCGFDPSPNLAGIYCDETGMDQGSVGGFPAVGFNASQVGAWCRQFLDASQASGYGNMLRAAAIFQAGNVSDWNGYNCEYALAEIGAEATR